MALSLAAAEDEELICLAMVDNRLAAVRETRLDEAAEEPIRRDSRDIDDICLLVV